MGDFIWIRGGRLIDPARNVDAVSDVFVHRGHVVEPPSEVPAGTRIVDARGRIVAPGFFDLHVHLREPGGEENETVATGSAAAAAGGFTSVVAMPNTRPPHDTPETVALVARLGREAHLTRVLPSGALTAGREGRRVTDYAALIAAGAVVFTDDGSTVQDDAVMEQAMRQARELGVTVMDHAQDRTMELQGGVMHEGLCSQRAGLPGIPTLAEAKAIRRDILLAEKTGCAVHIQHVSSREGVEAIRDGRRRGVRVTGELTPHHLALCDEDIDPADANYKMNPPLRSAADRDALREAVIDGTLSCFATDHAPHSADKKARGFLAAPFGIVGLETAIGVTWTKLVKPGLLTPSDWVKRWTVGPAEAIGWHGASLAPGNVADIVVIDTETAWTVDPAALHSKSKNTPFGGWTLQGHATCTILEGRIVHGG